MGGRGAGGGGGAQQGRQAQQRQRKGQQQGVAGASKEGWRARISRSGEGLGRGEGIGSKAQKKGNRQSVGREVEVHQGLQQQVQAQSIKKKAPRRGETKFAQHADGSLGRHLAHPAAFSHLL